MTRAVFLIVGLLATLSACSAPSDMASERSDFASATARFTSGPNVDPVLADTSLGRAISARLLAGPTLAAARAGERVAAARLADQRAATGPSLSLGASAVASTGSDPALQPTVQLSQLVFDGGASDFSIAAGQARTDAAAATTKARLTTRALDAVRAWEDLHRATRLVDFARASLERTREIEDRVELRRSSGAGRAAETLRVAARRAEAAATLARAEGERSAAQSRFAELLGAAVASGPIPQAPEIEEATANSPKLVELRADIRAAEAELSARRAERAPGVFVDVTGGLDGDDDPALGAGIRLDYAIDISGRRRAAIDAAQAEVERLKAEYTLAESDIRRGIADARSREAALRAERSASVAAETAASQALSDAEASFVSGRVDILDLLDLGRDLDRATSRRITVDAEYRLAGYDRLAASGTLLGVFGIDLDGDGQ